MSLDKKYDLVMLYSGGADSRLMLHWALQLRKKVYCILVDYGQKHIAELEYAIKHLTELGVAYQVVKLSGLNIDSGLTGNLVESRWENVHSANVPGRNSMFISIAYSIAENFGVTEIWYGPDYSDFENKFPDCYQSYVGNMNEVLKTAGVRPIKLYAPLLGWTKEMILEYLEKVVCVDMSEVHSGYEAPVKKCTCKHESCEVPECDCIIENGLV